MSEVHKTEAWPLRDVIIIGGGSGSYVLALQLAKKGLRSLIVERQKSVPDGKRTPRGEIIQPVGLAVLNQVGILKELQSADVYRFTKVHFRDVTGQHLCTTRYDVLGEPYGYALNIVPDLLQQILLTKVLAQPEIAVIWEGTFQSLIQEGGKIRGCEVMVQGKKQWFLAPVLVGADGAGSSVRSALGIPYRLHSYPEGYLTFWVNRPEGFDADLIYYIGKGVTLALFPVSKETLYLFYRIAAKDKLAIQAEGIDRFKANILSFNEEIRQCLSAPLEKVTSWDEVGFRPALRVRCKQWVTDGGVLMGDAAHAMNPHVANGRNTVMKDGMILADVIEHCFRSKDFSKEALMRYEAERRPEVDTLQRLGDELRFVWDTPFAPIVWARNRAFRKTHTDRYLHDKMINTMSGVAMQPFTLADRLRAML